MSKVFLALDYSQEKQCIEMAKKLAPYVGGFKIGLEYFTSFHWKGVEKIQKLGKPIFLDLKLHDIPNTVHRTVTTVSKHGVDFLSVHIAGGEDMLEGAIDAKGNTKIAGITLLSSISDPSSIGIFRGRPEVVTFAAMLAKKEKLDAIVCSTIDLHFIWPYPFLKIVPGIRAKEDEAYDQKMVATPEKAIKMGADFIVMGRSITINKDPIKTLQSINSFNP